MNPNLLGPLLLWTLAAQGQAEIDLARLTVPESRLATACTLTRPSVAPQIGLSTNAGFWLVNFQNPWHGVDVLMIATIRETIEGSSPQPDGPPLSAGEIKRFRARLAEDVEDAYAGFYDSSDGAPVAQVYALRFKTIDALRGSSGRRADIRITRGRTLVAAFGRPGDCLDAIGAYLKEIALP